MAYYSNLNVLSNKNRIPCEISDDAVEQIANMIKATGKNREQRKRLEKSLGNMQKAIQYSQKYLDKSAYREYQDAVDKNYTQFFAALGLTMAQDYRWREDETHDQISSLMERVNHKLEKYNKDGVFDTEGIISDCEKFAGVTLIPTLH